jgi:hypothetical protein
MTDNDRRDIVRRARDTLALYFLRGSAAAPGAVAFDLIALDLDGTATGGGATVCTDCASQVAAEAFATMYRMTLPSDHEPGTWQALVQVGVAPVYDLTPQTELLYDTYCAECELPIAGNHVNECNATTYVAGPREGRACFCHDVLRLHPVRRGDRSRLQDQHGNHYIELAATAPLTCTACQEPIRAGQLYHLSVHTNLPLCGRCTVVY